MTNQSYEAGRRAFISQGNPRLALSGPEYTRALTTLNLTPEQAASWLGIGRSTAYRYLKTGCEGPVMVAIRERVALETATRYDLEHDPENAWASMAPHIDGEYVVYADLTAAVGVGS